MKKLATVTSLSALALFLGGCDALSSLPLVGGLFGGGEEEWSVEPEPIVPSPEAEVFPTPTDPEMPTEPEAEAEEPDAPEETAPDLDAPPAIGANGLIPPTSGPARLRALQAGRPDPFAAVPIAPRLAATGTTTLGTGTPPAPVPPLPQTRPAPTQTRPAPTQTRPAPTQPTRPPASAPASPPPTATPPLPLPDFEPELPPLPQPDLARAVRVTGVVQVGNEVRAIVEPPNESSRYVRVGDYLANGQVLVKRIDINAGPDPIVVLEQFGIEVTRPVGDNEPSVGLLPG